MAAERALLGFIDRTKHLYLKFRKVPSKYTDISRGPEPFVSDLETKTPTQNISVSFCSSRLLYSHMRTCNVYIYEV